MYWDGKQLLHPSVNDNNSAYAIVFPPYPPELKREEKFVLEQSKEKETYSEVVEKGNRKRKNDQVEYKKMRIPELEVITTHCQCSEKEALELWNRYKDTSYIIQHFGKFQ